MQIIGQEKLINNIDSLLSRNDFPQAILLVGEKGAGKHSIARYISSKLDLDIIDISDKISDELISEIYLSATKNIYFLNFSSISIKAQNSLLKFLEEPPSNCIIICTCENKSQVIYTIQNRCQVWTLSRYSKQQLQAFTDNEYLLSICDTPGKIITFKAFTDVDIEYYKSLSNTILDRIYNANIANILTISDKLSFKEDEDKKLNIDLFIIMLKHSLLDKISSSNDLFKQYDLTEKLVNDFMIPHVNKKYLFENYLLKLKYSKG